jgi:hypothetical protein
MFVAILGDRHSTLPADWTKETAIAIAAEAALMWRLVPDRGPR